jgi:rod shape-determining protein MreC
LRKNNTKKPILFFIIFIFLIVILVVSSAKDRANVLILDNAVNITVKPFATFFSNTGKFFNAFFDYFYDKKKLVKSVGDLTYKNNMLEHKVSSLMSLELENARLRKLLDLKERYPSFNTISASVIAKDGGNYSRFITIDKGSQNGILVNQAVISNEGLVGLVFEVGYNWAKVQTILDSSTSVGSRIIRTGDISITEGDTSLINSGLLKLLYISKQFTISEGDIIETSGLGEIYPRGIVIGRIKEIKISQNANSQYATIIPSVNFSNIYEVLVVEGANGKR